MKKLVYLFATGVALSSGVALAQESPPLFEPVSGVFYLNLDDLNALLKQHEFAALPTPVSLTGSWAQVRAAEWLPLRLSIAEGATGSARDARRASLMLFYFSAFVDQRWPLSEVVPNLRGFVSGGVGLGTATLLLGQRAVEGRSLEDALPTAHDTLLKRTFLSVVPRAGIEFVLTDVITLRASFGYVWSFWSSPWEHFSEKISGPPKDFSGVLVEFTISYTPKLERKGEGKD